jgi:hypothetical protein
MANNFNIKPFDFSFLQSPQEQAPDFSAESDLIKSELKGTIESGGMSDFLKQMLIGGTKKIGRQAGRAQRGLREAGASSGFRGANVNVLSDLFEAEASQVGELQTGIGGIAEQSKAQALGQLIDVNQFDITTAEGRRQFEKMFGLKERELQAMIDAQGGDIGSIIGSILGTGVGIASGGAFSGIGTGLGNIFEDFFN